MSTARVPLSTIPLQTAVSKYENMLNTAYESHGPEGNEGQSQKLRKAGTNLIHKKPLKARQRALWQRAKTNPLKPPEGLWKSIE